ncbi:D-alanyl-D-alanine carboxypeptidase/D-alanyl-D-alanine-endopeptidase [uncultured Bacteroides sp.]|uniref:D-alanyl-D-alanine carboxypeptidase/D-alanyl-D-alanine endopeptidase n=1 Tax=uncultured Bacteroides sp. TaxID=162156 RepID=UPI002AAAEB45|nr:D-alanyl-D-alanine carboxypeptidase/D-alanyl-D-alanine-endopeptidase [uncultured Bacteroides sp.]
MAAFAQSGLKAKLNKLLKEDFLKTSEVGISIYDLTADKPLYTYQNNKLYRPASIQKLITVITGLSVLGPDHLFSTTLYHTGEIRNDTLNGDLYIVGGLDSEFIDPSMNGLVRMLSQSGIKAVKGKFVADVSMTDSLYWGAGWSWDDAPYSFQPKISPLMLQKGYVEIYANPTKKDSLAELVCVPASSYYSVKNQTVSNNPAMRDLDVSRHWMNNENDIVATGNVETAKRERITVSSSAGFFMHTFIQRAREKGIQLPDYTYGELPEDSSAVFFARLSHPLRLVLQRAMKNSDNLSAEAILYNTAAKESGKKHLNRGDGVKVIQRVISELGFNPKDYNIVDGCGVSLYNYISPELLIAYLKYAYSQKQVFKELYPALPIAGVDGTLGGRMKEGKAYKNVHAKTGSVTGVSSLAGYATVPNGHLIAFSIINQNVMENAKARAFQDKVCELLCE